MYFNPREDEVIYLNLNVSDMCNYRCIKCFQGKMTPSLDSFDLPELIKIIDQAKKELNIKAMYISGRGETFFVGSGNLEKKLENYKNLVKHANSIGIAIIQFTNGYYLTPDMVDFLVNHNISIVVSFDTLNEEKYNQLFGSPPGAFQKVKSNIEYARKHFAVETNDIKYYRFGINTAINHANINEINEIKKYCQDDIIFFSNYPMIKGSFKENLKEMCLTKQEYEEFKLKVKETSEYKWLMGICQNGACGFYYNGITIDVNGNVLLSPYDIDSGKLFGNITEYPSMREALKRVRTSIKEFLNKFPDGKTCPLRHSHYNEFYKFVKSKFI